MGEYEGKEKEEKAKNLVAEMIEDTQKGIED